MFGLALLPLGLMVGAAVDYSRASDAKTLLAAAADAAALSAVTPGALKLKAKKAEDLAGEQFRDKAAEVPFARKVEVTVKVKETAKGRNAEVAFTAEVPTTIMRLAGLSKMSIAGEAAASTAPPVYMDFHLMLDNTPSMGLGATPADIDTMTAKTACAFACHDLSGKQDYYKVAKQFGVTMRIDVVRTATQQLMETAATTAAVPGQFRAALHTFGGSCTALGLNTISKLTSNLSLVKTGAAAVDLMTIPYQNYNSDQCTDYNGTLAALNTAISTPGDGSTPAAPQKVVMFVSDGVADAYNPSTCTQPTTGGRCQEPINVANCQALKDRGIKVAVLYTTYLPIPTDSWYKQWIAPFASSIGAKMQACASPGLYFEVNPSQGIAEAMQALFAKSVAQARLWQ